MRGCVAYILVWERASAKFTHKNNNVISVVQLRGSGPVEHSK